MIYYARRRDQNLNGKIFTKKRSHVIRELMAVEEGLSSEEQAYYAHSMNTMSVVNTDKEY